MLDLGKAGVLRESVAAFGSQVTEYQRFGSPPGHANVSIGLR
jgi:hypothetical protein